MATILDIKLNRFDRVYRAGDTITGTVVVQDPKGFSFKQITLDLEGAIGLQLSAKSVGLFEAFYSSMKPVTIINKRTSLAQEGKCQRGESTFEFSIELATDNQLHETYHGVYINIQYTLVVDVIMGALKQNMKKSIEFIVEAPESKSVPVNAAKLNIIPASVERVHKGAIPDFRVCGKIDNLNCDLRKPLTVLNTRHPACLRCCGLREKSLWISAMTPGWPRLICS